MITLRLYRKFAMILLCSVVAANIQAQTTYTWNGTISDAWNTPGNWTPSAVPTATDHVVIVTASNPCTLPGNLSITNFSMTSGILNIGANTFTINGTFSATNGTINGAGNISINGTTVVFGNTTAGPTVFPNISITTLSIRSQRTTFHGNVTILKTTGSSALDNWRGGNTFNGTFYLNNASDDITGNNGDIYFGSNNGDPVDVFNGRTTIMITGAARIRIPQSGSAIFNGVTSFISNGFGGQHDRIQPSRQGSANYVFNDSVYFTCESATTDIHIAYEAGTSCIFNGPVVCTRKNGAGGALDVGRDGSVVFNHNLILNNNSTGAITVTNGTGISSLASGRIIAVGTEGFNSGSFDVRNFTQLGTLAQTLVFGTSASLFIGAAGSPCTFNATTINFSAGRVRSQSTTYNSTSISFSKTGATADDNGDNFFGGPVTFSNSGGAEFRFSSTIARDVFLSTVALNNSGAGMISMSRTFDTDYDFNIEINNPSVTAGGGIQFGANGGSSTLASGRTISVGGSGYEFGYLYLFRFNQLGGTPQSITLGSNSTLLRIGAQGNLISGSNFSGDFSGTAAGIELTGSTFQGSSVFNQTSTAGGNRTWGGNTFQGPHTINNYGTAGIQCSQLFAAETYLSTVVVNLSNSGGVSLARTFDTQFPQNIILSSTSTGSVAFGFNGGSSTLASGRTISISGLGYTGNFLYLYRFNQIGSTPQSLSINGASSQIELGSAGNASYGCVFDGNLTINAVNYVIVGNTFNGNCSFTKTGAGTHDASIGANTFNGSFSLTNNCTVSNILLRFSNLFGSDTFNGPVTLNSNCLNGGMEMGRTFDSFFNNNLQINSTNGFIYLGVGGVSLSGSCFLATNHTITTPTFSGGTLFFRRFEQLGITPQTISVTGTANIEYGSAAAGFSNSYCVFNGDLNSISSGSTSICNSSFKRNATISALRYPNVINSFFNENAGTSNISRVGGTTNDDLGGNNVFYSNLVFVNTGSGRFRMGTISYGGDTFHGDLEINNSGTGTISFAHGNTINSISGNINFINSNTGTIIFGETSTINSSTLAGTLNALSGNFTNGTISIRFMTQNGGANQFTGTGSAVSLVNHNSIINGSMDINTTSSVTLTNNTFNNAINSNSGGTSTIRTNTFNAVSNITSASFILGGTPAQGNTFNGVTSFLKNGTSNDDNNGGNIFNNQVSFTTTNVTGRWRLGTTTDDFNDNVLFSQNAVGILSPSYSAISFYSGNVTFSSPAGTSITSGSGAGRSTFDGNNAQSINLISGNLPVFTRMTLDKTSNAVTLNCPISITVDFSPTSGILNSSSTNIITLANGATTTIGNSNSYVDGPFDYQMASNSISRRTLNFPIGKASDWRPAILEVSHNNNTSYTYRGELFNSSAEALGWTKPGSIDLVSLVHWWDIDRFLTSTMTANSTTNLRTGLTDRPIITLHYGANDGVTDPSNLVICKNTSGAPTTWINIGGSGTGAGAGTITSTSSPSIFNSFSRFTLGNLLGGTNPLPVELLTFTAERSSKDVELNWVTASEQNSWYFEVERSLNGLDWQSIIHQTAAGNSTTLLTYSTLDYNAPQEILYYRLKQVDFDGTTNYSAIRIVYPENDEPELVLYPNPLVNGTSLYIKPNSSITSIDFELFNISGKLVGSFSGSVTNGIIEWPITEFTPGTYIIRICLNEKTYSSKIIIE
ncbi:MAG: T9SS type A sorting domain-containing protein [Flavobacteriales bacterium]